MNKFIVSEYPEVKNPELPVLFKIYIGLKGKYFIHKGKKLKESVDSFLDNIDRFTRDKSCSEYFQKAGSYCKLNPGVNKASIEIVFNGVATSILSREKAMLDKTKKDPDCLNNHELPQLKPEWMLKEAFIKRCDPCITDGTINGKKAKFRFCPNCGHMNK